MCEKMLTAQAALAKSEISSCCQTLCDKRRVTDYITHLENIVKQQREEIEMLREMINEYITE